jgi:hypothetical protein
MTCRLALRSASAGVSGMSRMTLLCGDSHRAGLAGRPGACGRFDRGVSRRGSFSEMIVDRLSASGAPPTGVALRAKRGHQKTAVLVPTCICMQ